MPSDGRPSMAADACPVQPPESSPSFVHLFQLDMANHHFNSAACAHVLCQLFGQEHRPVLAAGAAERHHQVLEAAALVSGHASIHERENISKILVNAHLLIEV